MIGHQPHQIFFGCLIGGEHGRSTSHGPRDSRNTSFPKTCNAISLGDSLGGVKNGSVVSSLLWRQGTVTLHSDKNEITWCCGKWGYCTSGKSTASLLKQRHVLATIFLFQIVLRSTENSKPRRLENELSHISCVNPFIESSYTIFFHINVFWHIQKPEGLSYILTRQYLYPNFYNI